PAGNRGPHAVTALTNYLRCSKSKSPGCPPGIFVFALADRPCQVNSDIRGPPTNPDSNLRRLVADCPNCVCGGPFMTATSTGIHGPSNAIPVAATLGALGVVYGDIGTSPLYALKEAAKAAAPGATPGPEDVLGVVSLIFWALILIISIKYALLLLRADNRGEGGIVAMLALLSARNAQPGTWRAHLLVVGLIGAALLYGDGAITP